MNKSIKEAMYTLVSTPTSDYVNSFGVPIFNFIEHRKEFREKYSVFLQKKMVDLYLRISRLSSHQMTVIGLPFKLHLCDK